MTRNRRALGATFALLDAVLAVEPACAQKYGGAQKLHTLDSPASISIFEEMYFRLKSQPYNYVPRR